MGAGSSANSTPKNIRQLAQDELNSYPPEQEQTNGPSNAFGSGGKVTNVQLSPLNTSGGGAGADNSITDRNSPAPKAQPVAAFPTRMAVPRHRQRRRQGQQNRSGGGGLNSSGSGVEADSDDSSSDVRSAVNGSNSGANTSGNNTGPDESFPVIQKKTQEEESNQKWRMAGGKGHGSGAGAGAGESNNGNSNNGNGSAVGAPPRSRILLQRQPQKPGVQIEINHGEITTDDEAGGAASTPKQLIEHVSNHFGEPNKEGSNSGNKQLPLKPLSNSRLEKFKSRLDGNGNRIRGGNKM
jgi:hypothetical protein